MSANCFMLRDFYDRKKILGFDSNSPSKLKPVLDQSNSEKAVLSHTGSIIPSIIVTKETPLQVYNEFNRKVFYDNWCD